MIIIDTKQMFFHAVSKVTKKYPGLPITNEVIRPDVTKLVHAYQQQFGDVYGEVVLAVDSASKPWRGLINPYYRWRRRTRVNQRSDVDPAVVNSTYRAIMAEYKKHLPVKVIDVECAEADDVIGVLVLENIGKERHLVVSIDHDFEQLLAYDGVTLFRPSAYDPENIMQGTIFNAPNRLGNDRFITYQKVDSAAARDIIKTHVIKGDPGDDVPNILSPLSTFKDGIRQKTMTKKLFEKYMAEYDTGFVEPDVIQRVKENRVLVDMQYINEDIKNEIIDIWTNYQVPSVSAYRAYQEDKELEIDFSNTNDG